MKSFSGDDNKVLKPGSNYEAEKNTIEMEDKTEMEGGEDFT